MIKAPSPKKDKRPDSNEILRRNGLDALRKLIDANRKSYHGKPTPVASIDAPNKGGGITAPRAETLGARARVIRRVAGCLSQVATQTEQHLLEIGVPLYQRSGKLVRPIVTTVSASNERETQTVALGEPAHEGFCGCWGFLPIAAREDGRYQYAIYSKSGWG
jgi:hypothetical protein